MKALVLIAVQVGVTLTVFGFGLNAAVEDLRRLISQPGLLVRSLLAVFVVMPILAVALVTVFDLHPTVRIALVALAISPVPPLIPRRESMARGSTAYGLGLMPILAALSILTIPVSLGALNRILDRSFQVSPAVVASIALRTALVPLAAGIIVRALMRARRQRRPAAFGGAIVLYLIVSVLVTVPYLVWRRWTSAAVQPAARPV